MKTLNQRRDQYRNMTTEDILRQMVDDELMMNVRRGGSAAKEEYERRKRKEKVLKDIIWTPDVDIGV